MGKKHKNKFRYNRENYDDYILPNTRLLIEPLAYEKMSHFIQSVDSEISGFGKIRHVIPNKTEKNPWLNIEKFILEDVEIFDQTCSHGGTTLDGAMLSKFIVQKIKNKQNPNDWKLWWHSHNDFGVMWSGIDETAISNLVNDGGPGSELFSICMNKHYDIIGRRDYHRKIMGIWRKHETLKIGIIQHTTSNIEKKCQKEISNKVKKYVWKVDPDIQKRIAEYNKCRDQRPVIVDIPRLREELNTDKPLLEDKRLVQPISSKDALMMGLYFNTRTGLFVRLSDRKPFTVDEVRRGLHKSMFGITAPVKKEE